MNWRNRPRFALVALLLAVAAPAGAAAAARVETAPPPASGPTAAALEDLMVGEFDVQDGQFADAARHYAKAAESTPDAGVAERATRLAILAGDLDEAGRALRRWEARAPGSVAFAATALQFHLTRKDPRAATLAAVRLVGIREGWRALLALLAGPLPDGAADTAKSALRGAVEAPAWPTAIDPNLAFAGLARRFGDTTVARRILDRLEAASPADPRVLVAAATLDREAGQPDTARARLARAQQAKLAPEVRRALAGELDALGDPAAAAATLAAGPQDDTSYMARAAWLVDAGDQAALALLDQEIQAAGLTPARRLLLGQIAETRSAWVEAERWYRGVDGGAERDRARLRVAYTLEKQGRTDEAMAWLQGLETGGELHDESLRDVYVQEAEAWSRRPDDARAVAAYQRGLAAFPDDALLLYARAMHEVKVGRVDEGLADLRRILDRDADNAEALNAYGYTLAEYKAKYAEALPYVEKSNRLQPGSSATLDSLGWIRLRLGDREAALPLLREAWSRGEDPEIAAHLGEVLWLAGDREQARRVWSRGRELDPDNRALRATMEKYRP